jgi:hypothetical protein
VTQSPAPAGGGSRAQRPGSRARRLLAAGLVVACVIGAAAYWAHARAAPAAARAAASASTYGGLPSWLPKPSIPVGRVVQASAAHPALGIEGDTMVVHVGTAAVTVTMVGPQVPEQGQVPVPATSPCSFAVTLTHASAAVPLAGRDFTVRDELGHLHDLRITASGGAPAPARVGPGQTVTLVMTAVLPTGSGALRWSPGSPRPVASWDFDVEID